MMGTLEGIWIKRARRGPMDPVSHATLVLDRGIDGNANQGGRRQVTVIASESWADMMAELNTTLDPSARRANLLVRGLDLVGSRGRQLMVGPCRIDVGGETRPCNRMDEALPGLQAAMDPAWRGGVYGTVSEGGMIEVGNVVQWAR